MNIEFQSANQDQVAAIWTILQEAIARRKADGSTQWQDGYPNPNVIQSDIDKKAAYVVLVDGCVVGYTALLVNDEPAYADLQGEWLTTGDFIVFHRVAISERYLGRGLAKKLLLFIEEYAVAHKIYSIKADTNFDNHAMMSIFDTLGYRYCGEVYFRGTPRKAYEKVLAPSKE